MKALLTSSLGGYSKVNGTRIPSALIQENGLADSAVHEIIAINDGSYILIDGERETLYGEAYLIKDAQMQQICRDNESVILK